MKGDDVRRLKELERELDALGGERLQREGDLKPADPAARGENRSRHP